MEDNNFKKKPSSKKKKQPKGRMSYPDPTTPNIPIAESPKTKKEENNGLIDPTIF